MKEVFFKAGYQISAASLAAQAPPEQNVAFLIHLRQRTRTNSRLGIKRAPQGRGMPGCIHVPWNRSRANTITYDTQAIQYRGLYWVEWSPRVRGTARGTSQRVRRARGVVVASAGGCTRRLMVLKSTQSISLGSLSLRHNKNKNTDSN